MKGRFWTKSLIGLAGWILPTIASVVGLPGTVQAAVGESPTNKPVPGPEPLTFSNPIYADGTTLYAGHGSHRSHSSHSSHYSSGSGGSTGHQSHASHASHYSSSNGTYVPAPSPQPQTPAPTYVAPPAQPYVAPAAQPERQGQTVRATGTTLVELVKKVQLKLVVEGYAPGPIDGAFGEQTKNALKQYQAAKGLPAEGYLGKMTLKMMRIVPPSNFEGVKLQSNGPATGIVGVPAFNSIRIGMTYREVTMIMGSMGVQDSENTTFGYLQSVYHWYPPGETVSYFKVQFRDGVVESKDNFGVTH